MTLLRFETVLNYAFSGTVSDTFCHTDVLCDVPQTKREDIAYHRRMIKNVREIFNKSRSDDWERVECYQERICGILRKTKPVQVTVQ